MDVLEQMIARAKAHPQRIVLPEGDEPRTLEAANILLRDKIAQLILIGSPEKILGMAAEKGFEVAFGKKPLAARRGGSIPIISTFEQVLGQKTVLMGFGLESNAIHSPNENMDLEVFENGIVAVTEFYKEFSK